MIACRPFSRVDRLWKAASVTNSLSNSQFPFQGFYRDHTFCFPNMGGGKDAPNSKDLQKKKKPIMPIWRPISTQSGSHKECMVMDLKTNSRYPYEAVDCTDEPTAGSTMSLISSASSVDYDHQSEAVEGKQSVPFSCEMDDLSETRESRDCVGGSESNRDLHKVEVIEDKDPVLPSAVEKHSVYVEAVKNPSLDYSHFVSLPLAIHPELVEKLHNFQSDILGDVTPIQNRDLDSKLNEDTSDDTDDKEKHSESSTVPVKLEVQNEKEHVRVMIETTNANYNASKLPKSSILSELGIDKSIFIKPKTFHLTVLMLKLWNKDRVAAATEVLQKISSKVKDALDNRPVSIRLKGLECMRGSPAKARVLYAPVEEIGQEGRLLRACQVIIDAYLEAGLVLEKDARQTLKLHATLMNASNRKRWKERSRRHDSFDARSIYKRYGAEEWGDYLIREAHLSQRFMFDESGYYHCCASIPFPESMQVE